MDRGWVGVVLTGVGGSKAGVTRGEPVGTIADSAHGHKTWNYHSVEQGGQQ